MSEPDGQGFASAAMMRLVSAGLARQGISVPLPPLSRAHMPRSQKRDVLDRVLSAYGPVAILSIADAARHMPPEPVLQALVRARDTGDLLERWHRLERFSHGSHTVEIRSLEDGVFRLLHRALSDGLPPSPSESLLVLAVITVMSEMIGSVEVSLETEAGDVWRKNGAWCKPTPSTLTACVILSASAGPPSNAHSPSPPAEDLVERLRDRVAADPLRRWTLAKLATEAGTSRRSLQRRLTEKSTSFSRLVSEARLQVAATHLCDATGPGLAEIGFLAGFADQAHFGRSFTRAVGTTPGSYRANFGR